MVSLSHDKHILLRTKNTLSNLTMNLISDISYGIVAGGIGTLTAICIPFETRNYLLWKVPVTLGDAIGETIGISGFGASALIGLFFGLVVCFGFALCRKRKKSMQT